MLLCINRMRNVLVCVIIAVHDGIASRFASHKSNVDVFKGHWIANIFYPGLSS